MVSLGAVEQGRLGQALTGWSRQVGASLGRLGKLRWGNAWRGVSCHGRYGMALRGT